MIPSKIKAFLDAQKVGRVRLQEEFPEYNETQIRSFINEYKEFYGWYGKSKPVHNLKELADNIVEALHSKPILDNARFTTPFTGKQEETANLVISDVHIGQKNSFSYPGDLKPRTTYNKEIFIKYTENLVHGIHRIVDLLSTSYKIDNLVVTMCGDIVENDTIYPGQRFHIDGAVGDQVMFGTKAFKELFEQLLSLFKTVTVHSVPGNHGRPGKPESAPATNNFDYMFTWILSQMFAGNDRIKFVLPESFYHWYKVYGWTYFMHHGNDTYSWMGIPYYGITRKSKAAFNEFPYNREIIGHFHTYMDIPNSSTSKTLVNGSWIKDSAYAWQRFRVLSRPEQRFFGISKSLPETWSFNIDLEKGRH